MGEPMEIFEGKSGWIWRCHPCDETSRSSEEQVARLAMAAHAKTRGHRANVGGEPITYSKPPPIFDPDLRLPGYAAGVADGRAEGFRRAIEALRDTEAYENWRITIDDPGPYAAENVLSARYLEHLATKESADG